MSERYPLHTAAEEAEKMREKINSGKASNYPEAEKMQERENIENLLGAKKSLSDINTDGDRSVDISSFSNLTYYLEKFGRTDLVARTLEALFEAARLDVQLAVEKLGHEISPSEEEFASYKNIMGHDVVKVVGIVDRYPNLPVNPKLYDATAKLIADYAFLIGDFRDGDIFNIYERIGNVEKFQEVQRRIKEAEDFSSYYGPNRSELSSNRYEERARKSKTPESIAALREANLAFLEAVKEEKESSIDLEKVLQEIEQEIDRELEKLG